MYFFQVTASLLILHNVHFQEIPIPNPRKITENAKRKGELSHLNISGKYKLKFPEGRGDKSKIHVKDNIQFNAISRIFRPGPVVQRLDNTIHQINHYPVDSVVCFVNTYPLDSDLSGG